MSFSGSLEDVSVADVLQFVHLGGRSGILTLISDGQRSEISFHRGRIISARSPLRPRLGEQLVENGQITKKQLDDALAQQKRMSRAIALGQVLVEMRVLSAEGLKTAFERYVEETVYDLVGLTRGTFEFAIDEMRPIDDLSMSPGDILPEIHVNTEMVLLEAARIFDERNAAATKQQATKIVEPTPKSINASETTAPSSTINRIAAEQKTRIQVISEDRALIEKLDRALAKHACFVIQISTRDAGSRLPGELSPIVIIDLRAGRAQPPLLASVHRARPNAALIALVDRGANHRESFAAGALAVLGEDVDVIAACVGNLIQVRSGIDDARQARDQLKAGTAKLRRVFGEFRSGLVTATISLNLMNLVSESVDRAVLFILARSELIVLGAFGTTPHGQALALHTRGFRMALDVAGAIGESLKDARSRTVSYEEALLPEAFTKTIGRPASGQCAIFPLLGSRKVIATMYADNGIKNRPIDDIEFLDMATSQVGMFYENELLRRKVQASTRSG